MALSDTIAALRALLSGIADAIREKDGSSGAIPTDAMAARIRAITTGTDTSDATVTNNNQIRQGYTAYSKGRKYTGSIPSLAASTWIPGVSAQVIPAGKYIAGAQTIQGDSALIPENIVAGKTIFGVGGTGGQKTAYLTASMVTFGNGTVSITLPEAANDIHAFAISARKGNGAPCLDGCRRSSTAWTCQYTDASWESVVFPSQNWVLNAAGTILTLDIRGVNLTNAGLSAVYGHVAYTPK